MKNNKEKKIRIILVLVIFILCLIAKSVVLAEANVNINLKMSQKRLLNGNETRIYKVNNNNEYIIFQLASVNATNQIENTNFYCLNQSSGYTWHRPEIENQTITYNKSYDMATERVAIKDLGTPDYNKVGNNENYQKILWILDHMYTGDGGITKDELLNNAGIVWGNTEYGEEMCWHYDSSTQIWKKGFDGYVANYNGNKKDIILSIDQIEAIQQVAIWHYTETENQDFDLYTDTTNDDELTSPGTWFISADETFSDYQTEDNKVEIKAMIQEQAAILFNYFIDGAEEATKNGKTYTSPGEGTTKVISTSNKNIEKIGTDYKIGPLKIQTTGNTTLTAIKVTTGTSNTDITADATVTGINKTSPEANKEFYITVPVSKVEGDIINVTANGKYTLVKKNLLICEVADAQMAEQPLVQYIPQTNNTADTPLNVSPDNLFDLALRKVITKVNGKTDIINELGKSANRNINIDKTSIPDTATYKHRKDPVIATEGSTITYQIHIYNEGDIAGYATKIVDQLPTGLKSNLTQGSTITSLVNKNKYTVNNNTTNNSIELTMSEKVKAIDPYDGTNLLSDIIEIECKVDDNVLTQESQKRYLTNIAYIEEEQKSDGTIITQDRENTESKASENPVTKTSFDKNVLNSTDANSYKGNSNNPSVYNDTNNETYFSGEEDDDDFEKLVIVSKFDLALRKFISGVSSTGKFDESSKKVRNLVIDSSKLKDGSATTAIYEHSKQPVQVQAGQYILYTIRVYNEGSVDGYASQITDYLPEYLEFVVSTDNTIKAINDNWTYDANTRKATTKSTAPNTTTKIKAFNAENDDGKGSGLSYVDVQMVCKINKDAVAGTKITNLAEITEYKDENGNTVEKDKDSSPKNLEYPSNPSEYKDTEIDRGDNYIPGQEDDDDFEKIIISRFDLALRKFITQVGKKEITSRNPIVGYENGKLTYTHPKTTLKVAVGDIITYTLRVYNEGDVSGYAEKISDDIPEYLEYLPDDATNKAYGWKMYDKDGKETENVEDAVKIVTNYTSKENGKNNVATDTTDDETGLQYNPNLLHGFKKDKEVNDKNPEYIDVKVAFKVKDPNSNKTIITNKAQISEDADENGEPIDDIDSITDKWNEGEDDQDIENVSVEYFDLSLLKYVSKAIVKENGKTTTIKTGNTGAKTDVIPKVEIYRKSVNSTVVKFEYVIKVTNEGDVEGYATEITDYVPKGLKFYSEDNKNWKNEGNNVISTTQLKNTLLKPGESATIKVILRWINGENNLGVKTNVAEISKDKNEKGIPDRDSTPDNKKDGEDDIDDAQVLLSISTGMRENTITYVTGAFIILSVLGIGIFMIRKYV